MPKLGEIIQGRDVREMKSSHIYYVWVQCSQCKDERWTSVQTTERDFYTGLCRRCLSKNRAARFLRRGEDSPMWKGGRHKDKEGYMVVYAHTNSPYYPMASQGGYIREHRLVMAKHLGRCLLPTETIHHINGIKDDNRIGNLLLSPNGKHSQLHHGVIKELGELRRRVEELEEENKRLRGKK